MRISRKAFFVCSLVVIFFTFFWLPKNDLGFCRHIKKEDQYLLEIFFRSLISLNDGCYVLFGDKPASVAFYPNSLCISFCNPNFIKYFNRTLLEKKGFEIWQKYKFHFPSRNYTIVQAKTESNDLAIFLIHKSRLLEILKQNFGYFKKKFSDYPSPECLFNAMLTEPSILGELCFKHSFLLGIILGFGEDNAALFEREKEIMDFLYSGDYKNKKQFNLMHPVPSKGFNSLQEELDAIEKKGGSIILPEEDLGDFWLHLPLGFLVDTTKTDLVQLRTKYKRQRTKATLFYQDNYLEVSLKALDRN